LSVGGGIDQLIDTSYFHKGIGYITSVAPVYQSEICLPMQRGWHLCCQLTTLLFGLLLAYWMNYGFYFRPGALQWRFPLLFQVIFAVYIILLTIWLPETPRWLMLHESSPDRGTVVLSKLRNLPIDHEVVQKEKNEILEAIKIESVEGTWSDLFRDGGFAGHKRFFLAVGAQFMQQMSGINIVSYYAPTIFTQSLGMSQQKALLVGGFLQIWYLFASFLTVCPCVSSPLVAGKSHGMNVYTDYRIVVDDRFGWP
jgi:hypothetical protein